MIFGIVYNLRFSFRISKKRTEYWYLCLSVFLRHKMLFTSYKLLTNKIWRKFYFPTKKFHWLELKLRKEINLFSWRRLFSRQTSTLTSNSRRNLPKYQPKSIVLQKISYFRQFTVNIDWIILCDYCVKFETFEQFIDYKHLEIISNFWRSIPPNFSVLRRRLTIWILSVSLRLDNFGVVFAWLKFKLIRFWVKNLDFKFYKFGL